MQLIKTLAAFGVALLFSVGVQAASLNLYGGGHVLGSQSVAGAGISGPVAAVAAARKGADVILAVETNTY